MLFCHGNQNSILLDHYNECKRYGDNKVSNGFHITKGAATSYNKYPVMSKHYRKNYLNRI